MSAGIPKSIKTFSSHDVDLCAFLMLHGLKFFESKIEEGINQKPRVIMYFFDEKGIAIDLERAFMSSEIAMFRQYHKYLLKQIHRTLKGI